MAGLFASTSGSARGTENPVRAGNPLGGEAWDVLLGGTLLREFEDVGGTVWQAQDGGFLLRIGPPLIRSANSVGDYVKIVGRLSKGLVRKSPGASVQIRYFGTEGKGLAEALRDELTNGLAAACRVSECAGIARRVKAVRGGDARADMGAVEIGITY